MTTALGYASRTSILESDSHSEARGRIASIDLVRKLAMVFMAIDGLQ